MSRRSNPSRIPGWLLVITGGDAAQDTGLDEPRLAILGKAKLVYSVNNSQR